MFCFFDYLQVLLIFLVFPKSTFNQIFKKTHEQGPEVDVKCTGKIGIFLPEGGGDE